MQLFRLFFILATVLSLVGCVVRTTSPQPPMYPQAEALTIDRSKQDQRVVMFQTRDTPAAVQTFFHDRLTYDGWEPGITEPDYRDYGYRTAEKMYALDVRTEAKPDGWTSIRVRFTFVGPGLAFPDNYPFPEGYK
jgi:hypothetical protein